MQRGTAHSQGMIVRSAAMLEGLGARRARLRASIVATLVDLGRWRRPLQGVMVCGLVSLSVGCGTPSPASPSPQWVETVTMDTITPPVTDTPHPTATFPPTQTPAPTVTRTPTAIPSPVASPSVAPTVTASPTPTPDDTPTPAIQRTPIQLITPEQIGEELTLEAEVVDTASFSAGFKYTLDDGTGRIVLLLWHNVYDDCWDIAKINRGATVRVTGRITEYEGQLEIQPRFGGHVKAVRPASEQGLGREIGSITGADEGQLVTIEGKVLRTEGLRSAVKVFVADETGEIPVFIWRNVLDRIIDNTGLGTTGSQVRVVGSVQIYRSNIEIVPTLPHDVTVLEIP